MLLTDYLGLVAGVLTTGSLVPQIIRVFRLKSAREISTIFTVSFLVGIVLWLAYGIKLGLIPVILWNAIGSVLGIMLLYAKMKYGR